MLLWLVWLEHTTVVALDSFGGSARPSCCKTAVMLQAQLYTWTGFEEAGMPYYTRHAGIAAA